MAKRREGVKLGTARVLATDDLMTIGQVKRRVALIEGGYALPDTIKAPPSEDDGVAPSAPSSLTAVAAADTLIAAEAASAKITIGWAIPTTDADGSPLTDLAGFEIWTSVNGGVKYDLTAPLMLPGETSFVMTGVPLSTSVLIRIYAVDKFLHRSAPGTTSVTTPAAAVVPNVSGLTLTSVSSGGVTAVCSGINRADMLGFVFQFAQSATDGGSDYGAWSTEQIIIAGANQSGRFAFAATPRKKVKVQAKAIVYGNVRSASWVESAAIVVTGINSSDFEVDGLNDEIDRMVGGGAVVLDSTGMVIKNGKLLFTSDDGTSQIPTSALRVGMQDNDIVAFDSGASTADQTVSSSLSLSQRVNTGAVPAGGKVMFGIYGRRVAAGGPLYLSLIDMTGSWITLETKSFDPVASASNSWHAFRFNTVWNDTKMYGVLLSTGAGSTSTFIWRSTTNVVSQLSFPMRAHPIPVTVDYNITNYYAKIRVGSWTAAAPQLAAFNGNGNKALIGQSGSFWGLLVENGALQIKTASDAVVVDSSGISGSVGGVQKFKLDNAGLALSDADITVAGGFIQVLGSGTGNEAVRIDANGLKIYKVANTSIVELNGAGLTLKSDDAALVCKNGSNVTVAKIGASGILLDASTKGLVVKNGTVEVATMDYNGFHVYDGVTEVVRLGKQADSSYGLLVTKGTIAGTNIMTALSSKRIHLNPTGGGSIDFWADKAHYANVETKTASIVVHDVLNGVMGYDSGVKISSLRSTGNAHLSLTSDADFGGGSCRFDVDGGNGMTNVYMQVSTIGEGAAWLASAEGKYISLEYDLTNARWTANTNARFQATDGVTVNGQAYFDVGSTAKFYIRGVGGKWSNSGVYLESKNNAGNYGQLWCESGKLWFSYDNGTSIQIA